MKTSTKAAFSMIELIFAIIIIGILAAVAIPNMSAGLDTSKERVLDVNIQAVQTQINSLKNSCTIKQKASSSLNINGVVISFSESCIPTTLESVMDTMQLETQAKTDITKRATYIAATGILTKKP